MQKINNGVCFGKSLIETEIIDEILDLYEKNHSNNFNDLVQGQPNLNGIMKDKGVDNRIDFNVPGPLTNLQMEAKKVFEGLSTDFFTAEIFSTQETIATFQHFVNNTFNNVIQHYLEDNKMNGLPAGQKMKNNDILFIYKGGTTMKILFEKYKLLFYNSDDMLKYESNFKRSDSDYSVIINPNFSEAEYVFHRRNIFLLVFCTLTYVRRVLLECIDSFLDLKLDSVKLMSLLTLYNDKINEITGDILLERKPYVQLTGERGKTLTKYTNKEDDKYIAKSVKDILIKIQIVGVYMQDRSIFIDDVSKTDFLNISNSDRTINIFGDNNDYNLFDIKRKNLDCGSKRRDFYIKNLDGNLAFYNFDDVHTYKNKRNYAYVSANENIVVDPDEPLNGFGLIRSKFNVTLIYRIIDNGILKYGILEAPAELIDVSIPNKKGDGLSNLYERLDESITKYQYINNPAFSYKSYTLDGFIHDLNQSIFKDVIPWFKEKSEKRIKRLMYFLLIKCLTDVRYVNNNRVLAYKMLNFIKDIFTTTNYTNEYATRTVVSIKLFKKIFAYDRFVLEFFDYLLGLFESKNIIDPITNTADTSVNYLVRNNDKFLAMAEIFREYSNLNMRIMGQNNTGYRNNIVHLGGNYEKKYLKYKAKYLKLREGMKI